jgi:hypothetical protein
VVFRRAGEYAGGILDFQKELFVKTALFVRCLPSGTYEATHQAKQVSSVKPLLKVSYASGI